MLTSTWYNNKIRHFPSFSPHNIIEKVGPIFFHNLNRTESVKTFFKEPQPQSAFIYSKITMETLEQYVKFVQG